MRLVNLLRVVVFAAAAGYLIFTQDHSVTTGAVALEFAGTALTIGGAALIMIPDLNVSKKLLVLPTVVAFACAYFIFMVGELQTEHLNPPNIIAFRILVALFVGSIAIMELVLSFDKDVVDQLDLRISAGIGLLTTAIFALVPLNDVNAVGILSAYLAVSAIHRAIWILSPKKG